MLEVIVLRIALRLLILDLAGRPCVLSAMGG
jgi:hypothetical protein